MNSISTIWYRIHYTEETALFASTIMTSGDHDSIDEFATGFDEEKATPASNGSLASENTLYDALPTPNHTQHAPQATSNSKNESMTALLQVVGAFFLMFNSW